MPRKKELENLTWVDITLGLLMKNWRELKEALEA